MKLNEFRNKIKDFENNYDQSSNVQLSPIAQKIINKEKLKYKYFKHIGKIGKNKDFEKIYDIDLIIDQLINILNIKKGSYPFNPNMGSTLINFIYEPYNVQTKNNIKNEVKRILSEYFSSVRLLNMNIFFFPKEKGFGVDITVLWKEQEKKIEIPFSKETYKYLF